MGFFEECCLKRPFCILRPNRHRGNDVNFSNYADGGIARWLRLCGIECVEAFLSKPLALVIFIFFPSYWVIAAISTLGILWSLMRFFCVNIAIATISCFVIVRTRWAPVVLSAVYFTKRSRDTQNIGGFQET